MKFQIFYRHFVLGASLVLLTPVWAWAETDLGTENQEDVQILYGTACERVKNQETISSIRLRATDKATFDAIKNLDIISSIQEKLNEHDLNVLIYNIVDNYVEDLGVQTTQQDAQKICVEISGYVNTDNIMNAMNTLQNEVNQPQQESADIASAEPVAPISTPTEENQETLSEAENTPEEPVVQNETEANDINDNVSESLLYIAPLEFFNNTSSREYSKILNRVYDNNAYFQLTEDESKAAYIIKSKVLRAKVDAINSNTNRMQMVISVSVKVQSSGEEITEHQNRFILFASKEDEQKVASGLMQKLLTKAGKIILNKVERMARRQAESFDNTSDAFITPKQSSTSVLLDAEK